jgi:hypothetical protein
VAMDAAKATGVTSVVTEVAVMVSRQGGEVEGVGGVAMAKTWVKVDLGQSRKSGPSGPPGQIWAKTTGRCYGVRPGSGWWALESVLLGQSRSGLEVGLAAIWADLKGGEVEQRGRHPTTVARRGGGGSRVAAGGDLCCRGGGGSDTPRQWLGRSKVTAEVEHDLRRGGGCRI